MNAATQSLLGRYRLVKVLGQGAMGVVYEAVDTRLGRTVAIKTVLRSHMADEAVAAEYAARFEREAQAAARLSHPHVVAVYDFGEHEDISYIVMEYVRGRELNQIFEANEKFSLAESVRIMRELLHALDYAHREGIVHRDVKPANVLIDGGGRVKLTDFGVARVVNANQDRTMPGTLVGTPSYMSPEQILGLAVGSRTDIFAAGVIFYQFLTGKRPFTGGGPFGVQRKIVQDEAVPPSQLNHDLPKGFDAIVARSLAKKPEDRYESAGAFAADLEHLASALSLTGAMLDLDLPDSPAAPAPGEVARPPGPSSQPGSPTSLTLITEVPFGNEPPPARPPTASLTSPPPLPFDPESTVIMVRPPVPNVAPSSGTVARPPTARGDAGTLSRQTGDAGALSRPVGDSGTQSRASSTGNQPSAAPPISRPLTQPPNPRSFAPPPRSATSQALATSSTHGAVDTTTAPGVSRRPTPAPTPAPPPVAARPPSALAPAAAPAPSATTVRMRRPVASVPTYRPPGFLRRTLAPLAGGVGVAAVGIALWLLVTKPSIAPSAPPGTPPAEPASAATAQPAPLPAPRPPAATRTAPLTQTPAPATAPTPVAATPAAADPSPANAPAQDAAASSAATVPTTVAPADGSYPKGASSSRRQQPEPSGVRGSPAEPARNPPRQQAPAATPTPTRTPGDARCNDLLQRMQLGEPLTPEQTSFFQTRCTR